MTKVSNLNRIKVFAAALLTVSALGISLATTSHAETAVVVPPATQLETVDPSTKLETVVLAGGCFWGVQDVFQHLNGVKSAVSGYAGGNADTAEYETVSTGTTGHAESVKITFDPSVVNFTTILQVYFSVAHNPTELNFQGPDSGTQYRSEIFAQSDAQKQVAQAYIDQLGKSAVFKAPIVTKIEMAKTFYPAEGYHQDYATLHPDQGYIAFNDLPKVANLKSLFPKLYRAEPVLVGSAG
ncbi:MAG: peptide-methionine (S)-S-oxide reductase MsrA [Pseudomonadota bacterium]|nr:peptide-methionine (S)-S-oxide reductase MsrA [Pseudomonadota bacterium]